MKLLTLVVWITIIAALVVGVCGCTSSSNTPTATPAATATPPTSATFDPTLVKLESALKAEYPGISITQTPANATVSSDYLGITYTLPNGNTLIGTADNGTVAAETGSYRVKVSPPPSDTVLDSANVTHFGQSAVASTLGGSVTSQDSNFQTPGTPYFSNEYILYTNGQNAIFFSLVDSASS